jgi:hypothetical protein
LTDKWIKKMREMYPMEYYLAFKKEEHPATFDNMDEPRKLDTL